MKTIVLIGVVAYMAMTCVARGGKWGDDCHPSDGKCCDTICPSGWIGFKGNCYHFAKELQTWSSGQGYCQALNPGSYLLDVNDATEDNWIKTQLSALGYCTDGHLSVDGTLCYSLSPTNLNQQDAKDFCTGQGKQLADLPNAAVLADIVSLYPPEALNGMWIGIEYNQLAMEWQDLNGNPQTYLPWNNAGGQPDDPSAQSCMVVKTNLLHDASCASANWPALCSEPIQYHAWIGANDVAVEGEFRSVRSGEILVYNNFPAGASADESKNCAAYDTPATGDWGWDSYACTSSKLVICEKDVDCFP